MRETENAHPFSRSASRAHCCSGTATIERMEKGRSIAFHLGSGRAGISQGCRDAMGKRPASIYPWEVSPNFRMLSASRNTRAVVGVVVHLTFPTTPTAALSNTRAPHPQA